MQRRDFIALASYVIVASLPQKRAVAQDTNLPDLMKLRNEKRNLTIEALWSFDRLVYAATILQENPGAADPIASLKAYDFYRGTITDPKSTLAVEDALSGKQKISTEHLKAPTQMLNQKLTEALNAKKLDPEQRDILQDDFSIVSQYLAVVVPAKNWWCEIYGVRRWLCAAG